MTHRTDLTAVITSSPTSDQLNAALFQTWEWQGRGLNELYTPSPDERRLRRRERAEYYGVNLAYDGE